MRQGAAVNLVRLPWYFSQDHLDRSLPTPEWHKVSKRHVWVDLRDPAMGELLDDARFYCDPYGPGAEDREYRGLRASAKATVRAIETALSKTVYKHTRTQSNGIVDKRNSRSRT